MPFPLRGRNCFIQDISFEGEQAKVDTEADAVASVEDITREPPKELDADSPRVLRDLFKIRLSKNLMEFGINLVDQASAAHIKVAVQIVVDTGLDVYAKGNIVADGTEFVVRSKTESYCKVSSLDVAAQIFDTLSGDFTTTSNMNLGLHGAIDLAAEKLSYRIHETLIDFYQDKPELPDFGYQSGANLVEGDLARKFDRSKVLQFLLLAALLGFVVYRYVEPDFLQTLRQYAGQGAAPAPVGEESAESYWKQGFEHFYKGQHDQAMADFNKAIKLDPKYAKAYNGRGACYVEKGQLDQAMADFNKALELDPNLAKAYGNRGSCYARKGQLDQAIADFNKALELDPKYAMAYIGRGSCYVGKGQLDQAIADYTKALELNPRYATAYYSRGLVYFKKGQYDQAIADHTKALELNPRYADAYNDRGNAYSLKGQIEQAIPDYTKALEINPKHPLAYYNRGFVYFRKGQYDQAIPDFNKALEINPKIPQAYARRAEAHFMKKEYDKAWEDVRQAQNLGHEVNPKFLQDLRKASGRKN